MRPHLYKRPCPLVGWSVGWLVMLLLNGAKNGILKILKDLDSVGRERETRRKEEQG